MNLSTCEIQSICDYLGIPANIADILNNNTGCNTRPEVELACNPVPPQCPSGNINFTTQGQIDSFAINYPTCTVLENVDIQENVSGAITNLVGFSAVEEMYILTISNNDSLQNPGRIE
ncbi:MAG: hypothetical protein R3B93_11295 [Bacteroidia bacterium]